MNEKIVKAIMCGIKTESGRSTQQVDIIQYGLLCIIQELEKFLLLTLIFGCAGFFSDFLLAFVTLVSLRIFIGGLHQNTNYGCFLHSFLIFAIILILANVVLFPILFSYFIYIAMVFWIWKFAPVVSEKRINYGIRQRKRFKRNALILLLGIVLVSIFAAAHTANIMSWVLVILLADGGIAVIKHREEERTSA